MTRRYLPHVERRMAEERADDERAFWGADPCGLESENQPDPIEEPENNHLARAREAKAQRIVNYLLGYLPDVFDGPDKIDALVYQLDRFSDDQWATLGEGAECITAPSVFTQEIVRNKLIALKDIVGLDPFARCQKGGA